MAHTDVSVSVVIPAYNCANTIGTAIQSAVAQTSPADEIIVVDDGSEDDTLSELGRFGLYINLIQQENQGAAIARQTGTDVAKGKYIAYLDADDWWPSGKLAETRELLVREPIHFLMADLRRARPGAGPDEYSERNITHFPRTQKHLEGHLISSTPHNLYRLPVERAVTLLLSGFPVFPSATVIRRDAIQAVGGWDGRFRRCQDFDLGLRLAEQYPLHFYDSVHAILGIHDGNEDQRSYSIMQLSGDIQVLKTRLGRQYPSEYKKRVARALSNKHYSLAKTYASSGRPTQSIRTYLKGLRWPGNRLKMFFRLSFLGRF